MNKQKRFLVVFLAFLGLSSVVWGNGLNLNSLGTRALSMGGAFIGLADDFSVAYWNPAGAARFKTKVLGVYITDLIPRSSYKLDVPTQAGMMTLVDTKGLTKHYLGGMAAYYHPVSEKLVLGIAAYQPCGLGVDWGDSKLAVLSGGENYNWMSKIGMISISPLAAYKVNDAVSVGAALNINYGLFDLKMHAGEAFGHDLGQYEESMTGWGLGATFGLHVKPTDKFSFGLTVRTPCTIKFKGDAEISNLSLFGYPGESALNRDLKFPLWIGGGVAFKPLSSLTLTADIQWTQWSIMKNINTDYTDSAWAVLMAATGKNVQKMDWKDSTQIRFGAEYAVHEGLALRAGYYHDSAPSPLTTINVLIPSYEYNVVTVGAGFKMFNLDVDAGFEYLMGKDRTVTYIQALTDPAYEAAQPGVFGMKILVPNISIGYRF